MIAEVAFPLAISGVFDYRVPVDIGEVYRGATVKVKLRNRSVWGVVTALKDRSEFKDLKEIEAVRDNRWKRSATALVDLYQWISSYYHTPLGQVFKPLISKKIVESAAKKERVYTLANRSVDLTVKQRGAVDRILERGGSFSASYLRESLGLSSHMLKILQEKGVLAITETEVIREPKVSEVEDSGCGLSDKQLVAVEEIWSRPDKPTLLHGVTGSGKTHIYIELTRRVLSEDRGVIILVPEISLTPQTIGRFKNIFSSVAVFHSRMSSGERRDSLDLVISGKARIIIGVRSSILAPMPNLGLIIIDEEHDSSYKQDSPAPRYHARDVAVMRGVLEGARVVLGSATPSIESYWNALSGKYHLHKIVDRYGGVSLPSIEIVDMNREAEEKRFAPFSKRMDSLIESAIESGGQIVILMNRRGFAVSLVCTSCGSVHQCPHCTVNLVYHSRGDYICCHSCGYRSSPTYNCPTCGGQEVVYSGTGIQKIEEYINERYSVKVLRMDSDTTSSKNGHQSIIDSFSRGEATILLGTQMVAKGLNFPRVDLVCVLQADRGLLVPDFRSSERLFQLLTQVAGRAGRATGNGHVVIQTRSPDEPAIQLAKKGDYEEFYRYEIAQREELCYPPFSRMARLVISGTNEEECSIWADRVADLIRGGAGAGISVLGPAPAFFFCVKKSFRFTILIRGTRVSELHSILHQCKTVFNKRPSRISFTIDIDPNNLS